MIQLDLGELVERWRDACGPGENEAATWAEIESTSLVESVLSASRASLESGSSNLQRDHSDLLSSVDRSTRSWARLQPSLPVLTLRLAALSQAIAPDAPEDGDAELFNKICELVSATAKEEFTLRMHKAAMTDPLTGIGNRRALEYAWQMAVTQAERLGKPACIVAIDLDGLKRINDFQGHAAGDEAIVSLCAAMRAALRDTDEIFRIGGDEFVALLPGSPAAAVSDLIARVQQFHAPRFSWGAADTMQDGSMLEDVLACADRRLYAQRRRNRQQTRSSAVTAPTPKSPYWSRLSPKRATEMATSGALALAIGAIVVSISGGNHHVCAAGTGPTVVNCGLSNAVYYGGIALICAGAIVLGVAVIVRMLLRGTDGP
ncbi:MAG: GGDEF domain-containing protein [Acidimicrobiales bacterium]